MLVVLAVLVIVTSSLLVFLARNPQLVREAESQLQVAASSIGRMSPNMRSSSDLEAAVIDADQALGARVLLFNSQGELVADSQADSQPAFESPSLRQQPANGGPRTLGLLIDENGQEWNYVSRNVQSRFTLVLARMRPSSPLQAILEEDLFQPLVQAGLLALGLSIVFSFLLARWIERPLKGISQATRNVASGAYSQVEPEGPSEVKRLIQAFNAMSKQVQNSRQSQQDFVANVSHDLRTPLTSVRGFGQAILDGTASKGKDLEHAAEVIVAESERMNRLVEELLDVARFDAGTVKLNLERINLASLLDSLADRFSLRAKEAGIQLKVEFGDLPEIQGDEDRLIQAFSNLIENAINHTPQEGWVLISAQDTQGQIKVAVSDTGRGIPAEDIDRIFERFYQVDKARTKEKGSGSGLGLSIVKQIIEAHQGRIWAESVEGKGSRFVVQLPIPQYK